MPTLPLRPCPHSGCGVLVVAGACAAHQRAQRQAAEVGRPSASRRLYTPRWRKAAAAYLRAHPLCECGECTRLHRVRASQVVDHILPHRGDRGLFWDRTNWRAMAKTCHDQKTAREDGGFGNRGRVSRIPDTFARETVRPPSRVSPQVFGAAGSGPQGGGGGA